MFGWYIPLIKLAVSSSLTGQEKILLKHARCFCRCAKVKYEGAIALDLSFVNMAVLRILFRSDGYTYLDLASSSYDMVCVWQKVCGSVRKLYWDTVLTIAHLLFEETPTNPLPTNTERKRVGVAGYVPMYIHCTSLAWSWCFTIQNIAIKGTLSQPLFWIYHYSGSTITSSSSSFFSFFHCFG